jgi:hypothetical protein
MNEACPWCEVEYELTPETEQQHLAVCEVFQNLPVAELKNGKTFVSLPSCSNILIERIKLQ